MSELAYDAEGDRFEVPANAAGWRVRRFRTVGARGAPEVVFGDDGRPLVLPVDAGIDEFRGAVAAVPGRYRLDPVDPNGRVIEKVAAAYLQLGDGLRAGGVPAAAPQSGDAMLGEVVRANAEMVKVIAEKFGGVMEAAAVLLRAADGAGLPARRPLAATENDEGEDDHDQGEETGDVEDAVIAPVGPFGGFDLNALVAQVVPMVINKVMTGGIDLSNLGALLDWRKAAPKGKAPSASAGAPAASAATSKPAPPTPAHPAANENASPAEAPTIEPAAMMHFLAIQKALTAEEAALAKEVAKGLTPAELHTWVGELTPLSVPDAVARIRAIIAKLAPVGGAS
jgi:hypothetical protein